MHLPIIDVSLLAGYLLLIGPVICLAAIIIAVPGGVGGIFSTGIAHSKFSLGSTDLGSIALIFGPATFWVVLLNGIVANISNFSVDQSYVQRYISASSDREAKTSVWITTLFYVPTAAFFFFIGTGLYALHAGRPDLFPAGVVKDADSVFPYSISHMLPLGLGGLFSGGILGVLVLGIICRRADRRAAAAGVIPGVIITLWMYFSTKSYWPAALGALRSPFHPFMIVVIANIATLTGGLIWAWLFGKAPPPKQSRGPAGARHHLDAARVAGMK